MPGDLTMTFRRDRYDEVACLEYSWVPQGIPLLIQLTPGQREGSRTDPAGNSEISHVQVYRLVNGHFGTDNWQFPPFGVPQDSPVVQATVEVHEQRMEVVGTVSRANGSSSSDRRPLKDDPLPCPRFPAKGD